MATPPILIVSRALYPATSAEGICIATTAIACHRLGLETHVMVPIKTWRPVTWNPDSLHGWYGIPPEVTIHRRLELPRQPWPYDGAAVSLARRLGAILYTRNGRVVPAALDAGLRCIIELQEPPLAVDKAGLLRTLRAGERGTVIFNSEILRRGVLADLGIADNGRTLVEPTSILADRYPLHIHTGNEIPEIGYWGSLYTGKGMEVIEPLARALPERRFTIIGGPANLRRSWRSRLSELDNVSFEGDIPPAIIPARVSRFAIALVPNQPSVVLPTGLDIGAITTPLKIAEAMATGAAIVASDLPVLRPYLEHGRSGLFADPSNIDAWAEAVESLVADWRLRQSLGAAARATFDSRLDALERTRLFLTRAGIHCRQD